MSPETPSPQQDNNEFSNPIADQVKEPEFGSDEFLEDAAAGINSHLDKISGKYTEVDSAIAQFRTESSSLKIGSPEYNTVFETLINKLTECNSKFPDNTLLAYIGDLQKDLLTFRML